MICFIIPPHILKAIAKHGDEEQKERAQHSLLISEKIRAERKALITHEPHPSPLLKGEGKQGNSFSSQEKVGMRFGKNRIIYTANNTTDLPGQQIRAEAQAPTNDPSADEAYYGTGATFDLYANTYARNSIDNKGMNLLSTVHYSEKYDNAFWDGQQMVYGEGDGDLFGLFTKPIDVTGHELTHGVTQYTANLEYQDQSGALNESFSDVFGSLVKQQVLGDTAEAADWLIGEGIFTSKVHGVALRSMKAPGTAYDDPVLGKDPQPTTMKEYVQTIDDNGGVHLNSGIPNHAFYLAAIGIGGHAWEKAGKIWYVTLTEKLQSNANFTGCATATIDVAEDLFGKGSKEENAVTNAWKTVGVI